MRKQQIFGIYARISHCAPICGYAHRCASEKSGHPMSGWLKKLNDAYWYDLNSIRYESPSHLMTLGYYCLWIVWTRHLHLQYGVNENKMTPTSMRICTALINHRICRALNNHIQLNSPKFSLWIEIALTFACLESKILMPCSIGWIYLEVLNERSAWLSLIKRTGNNGVCIKHDFIHGTLTLAFE